MTTARAWVRAADLPTAAVITIVAVALGVAWGPRSFSLALPAPVMTTWMVHAVLAVAVSLPLTAPYGVLNATFVRGAHDRALRAGVAALLGGASALVLVLTGSTPPQVLTWFLLLDVLTCLVAVVRPAACTLVPLAVALGTVLWEHFSVVDRPVSTAMLAVGPVVAAGCLLLAAAVYVAVPPRTFVEG